MNERILSSAIPHNHPSLTIIIWGKGNGMLPAQKNEKVMSILVMTLSVDLVPKLSINHYQTQKSRAATQQKTDTR